MEAYNNYVRQAARERSRKRDAAAELLATKEPLLGARITHRRECYFKRLTTDESIEVNECRLKWEKLRLSVQRSDDDSDDDSFVITHATDPADGTRYIRPCLPYRADDDAIKKKKGEDNYERFFGPLDGLTNDSTFDVTDQILFYDEHGHRSGGTDDDDAGIRGVRFLSSPHTTPENVGLTHL